ncbi:helix-turn-helix transcriptional regulator [Kaustia mangrovi]|uniref:Helix-turn-helix transcriptional regulator n=1 Tax=Kaustia mangrovi TaxID=2593653 RepID=A0A7S8HD20_9HYPH|nr:helix-turn-helix domain-containing protein [Kaustia mangrovi]QPC44039.1 helix-turn-helix transcriptional regulator [Kaustia mangrovi]
MEAHTHYKLDYRAFGAAVRDRRKALGHSLRKVEKESGVTHSVINSVEAGKACQAETFFNLCKWLETVPTTFMQEKPVDEEIEDEEEKEVT